MFYIKTEHNGECIQIEIHGDEIFTRCTACGKEIEADNDLLIAVLEEGDFASTSISCCDGNTPKLKRIK